MAIRDLLWACPLCGTEGGIRAGDDAEVCAACGARFRRGRGSLIVAQTDGGMERALPAAQWADLLPGLESTDRFAVGAPADRPLHRERAMARFGVGETPVRRGPMYMNRIERFGPLTEGELTLERDCLRFESEAGTAEEWPFDTLTAVQPSSSTLQIKACGRPVVSFRFPEGSARFWEELIAAALRIHYHAAGRGDIIEFQPRIVVR